MKIGLLIPAFISGVGGAEKVAFEVAKIIQKNGGQSTIVCNPRREQPEHLNEESKIKLLQVKLNNNDALRKVKCNFDLIIGFGMTSFFKRIVKISEIWNVPFIIQECTNPNRMIATLFVHQQDNCRTLEDAFWCRQRVFSKAAAIRLTVPKYEKSVHPEIRPNVHSFYNSFEPDEPITIKPVKKKIISVGAFKNTNKNGMVAVCSFARFAATYPDWRYVQYGKNVFEADFENLAAQDPKLLILDSGIERSISKIYDGAFGLVIPSYEEGLPNVVVEAFTYGVPCIGFSDCEGVNHLIKDGVNGFLVDRKDPEAITNALHKLTVKGVRQQFSRNASDFARENFKKQDFEDNWMNVIHSALGRNLKTLKTS